MRISFVLIFVAYVVQICAEKTSARVKLIGSLPICAQACITSAFEICACRLADFDCICKKEIFAPAVESCMKAGCQAARLQSEFEIISGFCPKPTTTADPSSSKQTRTSSSTATSESSTSQPQSSITQPPTPTTESTLPPIINPLPTSSPLPPNPPYATGAGFGGFHNFTNFSSSKNTYRPAPQNTNVAPHGAVAAGVMFVAISAGLFLLC